MQSHHVKCRINCIIVCVLINSYIAHSAIFAFYSVASLFGRALCARLVSSTYECVCNFLCFVKLYLYVISILCKISGMSAVSSIAGKWSIAANAWNFCAIVGFCVLLCLANSNIQFDFLAKGNHAKTVVALLLFVSWCFRSIYSQSFSTANHQIAINLQMDGKEKNVFFNDKQIEIYYDVNFGHFSFSTFDKVFLTQCVHNRNEKRNNVG